MLSITWKKVLLVAVSALAGSAMTVVIINTSAPAAIACDHGPETFKWVKPTSGGRDKEY